MYDLERFQVVQAYIALWVKANGKRAIGISELCLSCPRFHSAHFAFFSIGHVNETVFADI